MIYTYKINRKLDIIKIKKIEEKITINKSNAIILMKNKEWSKYYYELEKQIFKKNYMISIEFKNAIRSCFI